MIDHDEIGFSYRILMIQEGLDGEGERLFLM